MCESPSLLQEAPLGPEPVVPPLRVAPQPLGQGVGSRKDFSLDGRSVDLRINSHSIMKLRHSVITQPRKFGFLPTVPALPTWPPLLR